MHVPFNSSSIEFELTLFLVIEESFLNRNQTSNTSTTTPSAKQNAAMSTNGSNEVKNHSAGAYENVGYFKIEEVSTYFLNWI